MCFLVHDLCCIWYMYAVIYIYMYACVFLCMIYALYDLCMQLYIYIHIYHRQTFDSCWCVLSPIVISFPTKSLESLTSIRPSLSTMEVSV